MVFAIKINKHIQQSNSRVSIYLYSRMVLQIIYLTFSINKGYIPPKVLKFLRALTYPGLYEEEIFRLYMIYTALYVHLLR